MNFAIVYSNPNGNTKLLADTIYDSLDKEKCIYFGKTSEEALKADVIFIGFWTIRGACDDLTKRLLTALTNQKVVLFGSAGFGLSDDYFKEILNATMEYIPQDVEILETFMCQGRMKMAVKDKYLAMKKDNPKDTNIDMMIKNFDMALTHPDNNDLINLKNKALEVGKKYGFTL